MPIHVSALQYIIATLLILSSLGVILVKKPVHAALCFLLTLLMLATLYLELHAQFISVMQIIVYAGAILVIFVFVIVLFQDAHLQISEYPSRSSKVLRILAMVSFALMMAFLGSYFVHLPNATDQIGKDFGTVQNIGQNLYLHFFFPFEAITLLFLVAGVGALYIAKKEN